VPVINCEGTGDPQHAGHHQGALNPGGDAPEGLPVHAARVPKAPTDRRHPGWRACRPTGCTAAGAVLSCGSWSSQVRCDGWPDLASGPHLCTPPGRALGASRHTWDQIEGFRPVSRLSAAIPHAASRRTTAPCPASALSRAEVVPDKATEGLVTWCGWHGMQGVRGSNPLSSTTTNPQVSVTARPSPHHPLNQCHPPGAAPGPRAP
jgi:hypothetical protein